MRPGITDSPRKSMRRVFGPARRFTSTLLPTPTMRSPLTASACAMENRSSTVMTLPFEKIMSGAVCCAPMNEAALTNASNAATAILDVQGVMFFASYSRWDYRACHYNETHQSRSNTMNVLFIIAALMSTPAAAQWKHVTPGIPRLPDGKPNLSAPAPKTPEGKPDITGLWKPGAGYIGNIAKDIKPEDFPFQPWAEALYKERRANN